MTAVATAPDDDAPQRVISLSPSITEWLFALHAGGQVVAVDSYSTSRRKRRRPNQRLPAQRRGARRLRPRPRAAEQRPRRHRGRARRRRHPGDRGAHTSRRRRAPCQRHGDRRSRRPRRQAAAAVVQLDADLAAAAGGNALSDTPPPAALRRHAPTTGNQRCVPHRHLRDVDRVADRPARVGEHRRRRRPGRRCLPTALRRGGARRRPGPDRDRLGIWYLADRDEVADRPGWRTLTAAAGGNVVVLDSDVPPLGPRVVDLVAAVATAVP